MPFNSIIFLVFAALFFALWPLAKRTDNGRWVTITAASLVFYGWWDWRFIFLLLGAGLNDYATARAMAAWPSWKRWFLVASLAGNLGSLSVFKYAGFIAENVIKGRVKQASARHVIEKAGDYTIIDVREKIETGFGMIPGAINIPLNTLRYHIKELPKDKKILIYCAVGLRGYIAARQLMNRGITEVYNLSGGFTTYNMLKGMDSH